VAPQVKGDHEVARLLGPNGQRLPEIGATSLPVHEDQPRGVEHCGNIEAGGKACPVGCDEQRSALLQMSALAAGDQKSSRPQEKERYG
jgi:hypothetical protein